MKINPSDYNYKALAAGSSVKYAHKGCSSSLAMKVTVNVDGCLFKCFKCNETAFVRHEGQSWRDRKQRETEIAAAHAEKAREGFALPVDFSRQIGMAGLAWLGSGGWTTALIDHYKIGWSDKLNRVVIPIQPMGYIARAVFEDQHPKYLAKAQAKARWYSAPITQGAMVVTEDVLSAGRTGQMVQTEALLGTPKDWVPPIGVTHLGIWTDDDKAGEACRAAVKRRSIWLGVRITDIVTKRDPKCYSDHEITDILKGHGMINV